ncbi:MAG: Gfo/Idh/MocA family oxidoreductase [Gemmataceae bacterium]|nr:Gfo/Idh/MocA family oxidoreductase [Gemmataceae bacterium]
MKAAALAMTLSALLAAVPAAPPAPPDWATKDLRAGIIGTDTSHVPEFTKLLNQTHPEWRVKVVAAFKGGSPDLPVSADRVEKFAAAVRDDHAVEIVGSIDELLRKVDVVLLESVDGRPHLAQVTPVLKAGKRVFVDKPLAACLADARAIAALSKETGTPFFTASSYRFHPDVPKLRAAAAAGKATKVQASSPFNTLAHHPDLFFYGVHGVEALYAAMGLGCVSVTRKTTADADITTGKWKDGRVGVYHGTLGKGQAPPLLRVWDEAGTTDSAGAAGYGGLVRAVAEFFHTGRPPVDPAESVEVFEFMTAAQLSGERGGAAVPLADLRK